jgi:predicted ATPase
LALQTVKGLVPNFKDGVWLVELAGVKEPARVIQSVAQVLAVREERGKGLINNLVDFLRLKQLLLVLDNCEHQVETCAELAANLLHACPDLRVIVTSRENLGIIGETIYLVPPLSLPQLIEGFNHPPLPLELEQLNQFEAVKLLVERGTAVQPNFKLKQDNARFIVQVCQQLDGLPLALELAAARINLFPVGQLAEQIDKVLGARFQLLKSGNRTAFPHHRTLRGLIDWSYNLLSQREQSLLSRLAVFSGSFNLEAVAAVALESESENIIQYQGERVVLSQQGPGLTTLQDSSVSQFEAQELLGQLVNKSVALVEHKAGEVRYRLLETIRQYAWKKLEEHGETELFRRKHCLYFLQLVEQTEMFLASPHQDSLLKKLKLEYDNIQATFSWVMSRARTELENRALSPNQSSIEEEWLEYGLRLAGAMAYFMFLTGYTSEGWEWLEQGLNWTGSGSEPYRARALRGATLIANFRGDFEEAERLGQEAVTLFRQLGNREGLAEALNNLSQTNCVLGRFETAISQAEESASLYGPLRQTAENHSKSLNKRNIARVDPAFLAGLATSLYYLGYIRLLADQIEEAHSILNEVLTIFKEIEVEPGLGQVISLNALGLIYIRKANYSEARNILEQSLQLAQEKDHKRGIPPALFASGWLAFEKGEYHQAQELLTKSVQVLVDMGERSFLISNLELLAGALAAQDQSKAEKGAALIGLAQAIRDRIHTPEPPLFQGFYRRCMELAHSQLDEPGFTQCWKKGQNMYEKRTGEINQLQMVLSI